MGLKSRREELMSTECFIGDNGPLKNCSNFLKVVCLSTRGEVDFDGVEMELTFSLLWPFNGFAVLFKGFIGFSICKGDLLGAIGFFIEATFLL